MGLSSRGLGNMDISINSGKYARLDSLHAIAEAMDENFNQVSYKIEALYALIEAQGEQLDNLERKLDFISSKYKESIVSVVPTKYRAALNSKLALVLADADSYYNEDANDILNSTTEKINKLKTKYKTQ
jgi:archaellum component FlaC